MSIFSSPQAIATSGYQPVPVVFYHFSACFSSFIPICLLLGFRELQVQRKGGWKSGNIRKDITLIGSCVTGFMFPGSVVCMKLDLSLSYSYFFLTFAMVLLGSSNYNSLDLGLGASLFQLFALDYFWMPNKPVFTQHLAYWCWVSSAIQTDSLERYQDDLKSALCLLICPHQAHGKHPWILLTDKLRDHSHSLLPLIFPDVWSSLSLFFHEHLWWPFLYAFIGA